MNLPTIYERLGMLIGLPPLGLIYAPYIPLYRVPTLPEGMDPADLPPEYAVRMIDGAMYSEVDVSNL